MPADWSPWNPPYPSPGQAHSTPYPSRGRHVPAHRRPSRLRAAARALAAGAARAAAAPLYIPHIIYTRLEAAWTTTKLA